MSEPIPPLASWQARMKLNKLEISIALGIARNTLDGYLNGSQPIPKYIALACAAIEKKIKPIS